MRLLVLASALAVPLATAASARSGEFTALLDRLTPFLSSAEPQTIEGIMVEEVSFEVTPLGESCDIVANVRIDSGTPPSSLRLSVNTAVVDAESIAAFGWPGVDGQATGLIRVPTTDAGDSGFELTANTQSPLYDTFATDVSAGGDVSCSEAACTLTAQEGSMEIFVAPAASDTHPEIVIADLNRLIALCAQEPAQ